MTAIAFTQSRASIDKAQERITGAQIMARRITKALSANDNRKGRAETKTAQGIVQRELTTFMLECERAGYDSRPNTDEVLNACWISIALTFAVVIGLLVGMAI